MEIEGSPKHTFSGSCVTQPLVDRAYHRLGPGGKPNPQFVPDADMEYHFRRNRSQSKYPRSPSRVYNVPVNLQILIDSICILFGAVFT